MSSADQSSPALKEIFNAERLQHIATEMTAVYPAFNAKAFLTLANDGLAGLSVMQRLARVSESLHVVIALDYDLQHAIALIGENSDRHFPRSSSWMISLNPSLG